MARPDPNAIRRLPQASAPPHFVRARRDAAPTTAGALRLFDAQGALDVDALFRLVDDGEVTLEGRVYGVGPQARFMGSAVLELDVDVALAPRLRAALSGDARARRVLEDRAFREVARLLGSRTPAVLEIDQTVGGRGGRVRVDVDLEGQIGAKADAV
jgi:hypothetical protein